MVLRIIAGSARGRQLKTRKGSQTRPTADKVKESFFNIISKRLEGAFFLDIFAGNGGIGIEALSRGAEKCVFIEKNTHCVKIIKENLLLSGLQAQGEVLQLEALTALAQLKTKQQQFDIIFLDPPYHSPVLAPALTNLAASNLLAAAGIVVVEHHRQHIDWWQSEEWQTRRVKKYGDTILTFLTPSELEVKGGT